MNIKKATVTVFGEAHDAKTWGGLVDMLPSEEIQDLQNRALRMKGSLRQEDERGQ